MGSKPLVILHVSPGSDKGPLWQRLLAERLPGVEVRDWPDVGDPSRIEIALTWKAPPGLLGTLPNLRLICSLGMGVDHVLDDASLPRHVPVVRLVDPNMVEQMSEYVLYGVLRFHRRFDVYERQQQACEWRELPLPHTARRCVGVMGLGANGLDAARKLRALGFRVVGWSRTPKVEPGIESFEGEAGLAAFLARCEILVVLLPLTRATAGLLDARAFARLPRGAAIVNLARGGLLVEEDLIAALDGGQVSGALLDVTQVEPLPARSRLWSHPAVRVTPHIAGLTNPETAVVEIADNIGRLQRGEPLRHRADGERGY